MKQYLSNAKSPLGKRALLKITIKSVIFVMLTYFLLFGPIGLIKGNSSSLRYFVSFAFLTNFIILLFVMVLYDLMVSRRLYMYENIISILFLSFALLYENLGLFIFSLLVFLCVFLGSIIGGFLRSGAMKAGIKREISGAITLVFIFLFFYILSPYLIYTSHSTNIPVINPSTNNNLSTKNSTSLVLTSAETLNRCQSNVQEQISILKAELPVGSTVSIVNETEFYSRGGQTTKIINITLPTYGPDYNIAQNNFSDSINNWIETWSELPYQSGVPTKVNCYSKDYYDYEGVPYICANLNTLALEAESLNNSGIYVVGFIIKVQPNYSGASVNVAYTNPILCNGSGQIMNGSLDWLKSIPTTE